MAKVVSESMTISVMSVTRASGGGASPLRRVRRRESGPISAFVALHMSW